MLATPIAAIHQHGTTTESRHTISGRIADPHHLRPEGAILTFGAERDGSFGATPVPVQLDGTFITPRVESGTYVLQIVRTSHSDARAATVVGLTIVPVTTGDVKDVTITIRKDTAITGTFRMESDDRNARWPSSIVAGAWLALDGMPLVGSVAAEGAQGGRFVLRNAFGPRVLRCGYTLAGTRWWPKQVLLDGLDVTNVPTDFSQRENGRLEVVFTRHPARLRGTVTGNGGQAVNQPWIYVIAADPKLQQRWASTRDLVRADTGGRFDLALLPGRYFVRARTLTHFASRSTLFRDVVRFAAEGLPVEVGDREQKTIALTVQ